MVEENRLGCSIRVLKTIEYLQNSQHIGRTIAEIAEYIKVSRKTARRYLLAIGKMGYPIYEEIISPLDERVVGHSYNTKIWKIHVRRSHSSVEKARLLNILVNRLDKIVELVQKNEVNHDNPIKLLLDYIDDPQISEAFEKLTKAGAVKYD